MKKQNEFQQIINRLACRYPFLLTEKEIAGNFPQAAPVLKKSKVLKRTDNEKFVLCPGADQACLREVAKVIEGELVK